MEIRHTGITVYFYVPNEDVSDESSLEAPAMFDFVSFIMSSFSFLTGDGQSIGKNIDL